MAKPIARGLNYTRLDVSFFQDRKVRRLRRRMGSDAPLVYIALLCTIFAEGYYIKWDGDMAFDLADMTGMDEGYVEDVVNACVEVGLLSKKMLDKYSILTSHGIQRQYTAISEQSKRIARVEEYSLLESSEDYEENKGKIDQSSEDTPKNGAKKRQSSEFTPQIKEKEIKENYSSSCSSSDEFVTEEEEEKEKILYFFTFSKNWIAPNKEYEKLLAYNRGPQVRKKWDKMSAEEKNTCLRMWHQEPSQPRRFNDDFLALWQKVYEKLLETAPFAIRIAALSDGVSYVDGLSEFTLIVPESLMEYLEENMDIFKPILWPYIQSHGNNKLAYQLCK